MNQQRHPTAPRQTAAAKMALLLHSQTQSLTCLCLPSSSLAGAHHAACWWQ